MTLGQKLRFFRKAEGYTQKEISDRLSMERSTYTYYERDKSLPNVYTLFHLARLYGVSMELFVDERVVPLGGKESLACVREHLKKSKSI